MSMDNKDSFQFGRREEKLFLRGDLDPWSLALVELEKEGGKMMCTLEKEHKLALDECGTKSGPVPHAVPVGPSSGCLRAAIISLSLMSVDVTAVMAEYKSYIRSCKMKCRVEFFPVEK